MTRDIRRLADGQVVYTALCNETGGMIDDSTVSASRRLTSASSEAPSTTASGCVSRQAARPARLGQGLDGRASQRRRARTGEPDLLTPLIWTAPTQTPFAELKWFRFSIARIGGPQGLPLIASRTGYSGELGYELFCHPKDAPALWEVVLEAGESHGLTPLGLEALDMIRIEAGLVFAGSEFDDQVDPFEAGIGFTVTADKEDSFVGREALAERREHPQRVLVGLELEGNEPAGHGDCVHVDRHQVGVVTSGTRSPVLKKNVALCRMNIRYCGARHGGRGRKARRVPEADPGDRRPLSLLRPRQDPPSFVSSARRRERRSRQSGPCVQEHKAELSCRLSSSGVADLRSVRGPPISSRRSTATASGFMSCRRNFVSGHHPRDPRRFRAPVRRVVALVTPAMAGVRGKRRTDGPSLAGHGEQSLQM